MPGNAACIGARVGDLSSQIYDFLKFRWEICAVACKTTSIIRLGNKVQLWTQGGGGAFKEIKLGGGAYEAYRLFFFWIPFISCLILYLDPTALNPREVNGVCGGRHDIKMFQWHCSWVMTGNIIKWIGGNQEKGNEIRVREKGKGTLCTLLGVFF